MTAMPMDPRRSPIADILAMPAPPGMPQQAPAPFVWGQGGARLTPDQLAGEREIAQALAQSDYSPVGHWTQGLGRVLDNFTGSQDLKRLDGEEAQMNEQRAAQIAELLGPQNADLAGAFSSGDKTLGSLAGGIMESRTPKQTAPHYWETNDGSLGMIGPDGQPVIVYQDPTEKINWIQADNGDGTKALIPMGQRGPIAGGGGQASTAQPDWTSAFSPEELRVMQGEAARRGQGAPSGSPLSPAANSKTVNGKQYWNVGGEWYDNPEGR